MNFPIISDEIMKKVREDQTPTSEKLYKFWQAQPNVSNSVAEQLGVEEEGLATVSAMADMYLALSLAFQQDENKPEPKQYAKPTNTEKTADLRIDW